MSASEEIVGHLFFEDLTAHQIYSPYRTEVAMRSVLYIFCVLTLICGITQAGLLDRSRRQAATFGTNGYCGGYNDVDCSAVCFWNRFTYYQCRPDLCYCY
ncbi:unnamed protein product [Allacma fusca]|uniref:Defensin n=1 Tax=Allacma fusca TaxID=39272 RepID=A0A8J2KBK5_9HEXA|nr:unnamed protein product [Allacma fusca]